MPLALPGMDPYIEWMRKFGAISYNNLRPEIQGQPNPLIRPYCAFDSARDV